MIHHLASRLGPPARPIRGLTLAATLLALGLGLVRPAAAQTIQVNATDLSAIGNLAPGQEPPRLYEAPVSSVSGRTVIGMNEPNWSEYTFTVGTAGLYNVALNYATPLSGVSVTLDVRKAGSDVHYAVSGVNTPSTGDWVAFQNATAVSMPLQAGANILRVHNLGGYNAVPHTGGRTGNGLNIGGFTLTRTGALPATGTISGTVSASDLALNIGGAVVMAMDPAKTVTEPSLSWYNGYWTTTGANGQYSLPVPAGAYTVRAGRPDTYAFAGGTKTGVNVTAGGTATADVTMASRWASNALLVESEDFHNKRADVIGGAAQTGWGTQVATWASGGRALGWIDDGDFADLWVDVPASGQGWYRIEHIYQNGGATGVVEYSTDRGSAVRDYVANTGNWDVTKTYAFTKPIYLFAGRNEIRQKLITPNSNLDAFRLVKTTNNDTTTRAEMENFLNFGAGSGASVTGGSGGVNIFAGGNTPGLDGKVVSGSAIGSFSTWSQNGIAPEYLDFNVNAPKTGLYTMDLRAGTPVLSVSLRVWNLSYGPIIDNAFAFSLSDFGEDKYTTVTGPNPVPLVEGPNRLRIYIVDAGMNADYVEFNYSEALTGYGFVSGTVTANGQPVPQAQVSIPNDFDFPAGNPVALGFRAITDAQGRYSLLAPAASRLVSAAALGYGDSTTAGANATVDVSSTTPRTQNFTLTRDNKYEAEWFTNAWQWNGSPAKDHGVGAVEPPIDVAASQGQVVSAFGTTAGEKEFIEFAVNAPTAGLYTLTLQYAIDGTVNMRVVVPESGADFVEPLTSTGGFNAYSSLAFSRSVPLVAGRNTVRLYNDSEAGEVNVDFFTLTPTGQQARVVSGTVTNISATPNVPVEGVTVTASQGDAVVATTTTAANGTYTLLLAPGTYSITPAKTGYTGTPQTVDVSTADKTVNFTMTQGAITGKVTDQTGQPLAGIKVRAYAQESDIGYDLNNANYNSHILNQTVTDAQGNYSLAVRQGSAIVIAGAPMSIPARATVNASPSATANLVVTKLEGGTPVNLQYNHDWFYDTPNSGDADVDGIFHLPGIKAAWTPAEAFDAAVAGQPITLAGVPFKLGNPTGLNDNVRSLDSPWNTIDVPDGKYAAAVILGTSSNGNWPSDYAFLKQGATPSDPPIPIQGATITYADGSTSNTLFHLPNWGYNQGALGAEFRENAWEVLQWDRRSNNSSSWEFIRFNLVAAVLPLDPNKVVASITLPEDLSLDTQMTNPFIFAVTLANAAQPPLGKAQRAMKIWGGLEAAPASNSADFTGLNVETSGTSATRIDILDVVKLTKQGM